MSESPAEGNPPLYASFEKAYRDASFTPLPVGPDKKPLVKGWTAICPTAAEFEQRLRFHPDANIGLMAGTILSNGNTIAFVDVDEERIVPFICEAVGPVKSANAAQKGLTVIVQAAPGLKSLKLRAPDKSKPIVEFMISTGMVVLPHQRIPRAWPIAGSANRYWTSIRRTSLF